MIPPPVSSEIERLSKLTANIPPEQHSIANNLIEQMAYSMSNAKQLQDKINEKGPRPVLTRSRNAELRLYTLIAGQLLKMLPDSEKEEGKDELLEFLKLYN